MDPIRKIPKKFTKKFGNKVQDFQAGLGNIPSSTQEIQLEL